MKNVVKLLSILLIASCVVFISCGKDTKIDPPTKLSVTDVSVFSAKFTWNGTADSYEIMLGSQTSIVTSTFHSVTDLTEGTLYTWKVRSKKGNDYSEWVDGPDFTTKVIPEGGVSWFLEMKVG